MIGSERARQVSDATRESWRRWLDARGDFREPSSENANTLLNEYLDAFATEFRRHVWELKP